MLRVGPAGRVVRAPAAEVRVAAVRRAGDDAPVAAVVVQEALLGGPRPAHAQAVHLVGVRDRHGEGLDVGDEVALDPLGDPAPVHMRQPALVPRAPPLEKSRYHRRYEQLVASEVVVVDVYVSAPQHVSLEHLVGVVDLPLDYSCCSRPFSAVLQTAVQRVELAIHVSIRARFIIRHWILKPDRCIQEYAPCLHEAQVPANAPHEEYQCNQGQNEMGHLYPPRGDYDMLLGAVLCRVRSDVEDVVHIVFVPT
mmetsp:Transcript_62117/g.175157  ORF Transcript_62117/g.175157 Transcript_62117/m.175157 type:complete len:252 (-) Transcript_62117:129-884(-)